MGLLSGIAGSTAAATSSTGTAAPSLAGDFNTFLTLLTTQLQNQDPTSPVDSNQFTQQLVEFAGVQQQVQSNTLLQQLVTNSQASQVSSASSFIGTNITATGNSGALTNGKATFGYTLPSAATAANVTISDSNGNIVFEGTGSTNAGNNPVSWDGTNSFTGATEPDGVYTIAVKAVGSAGNAITATPYVTGTVDSASISNGSVVLNIGSLSIPEANVTSVTNLPGTQTTSVPPTTTTPTS